MLTREENELLVRVGPGTPMGEMMRRYWVPACLSEELPEPDCDPFKVRLLGENLIAFRDSQGRVGLMDELCPHRRAGLFLALSVAQIVFAKVETAQWQLLDSPSALPATDRGAGGCGSTGH